MLSRMTRIGLLGAGVVAAGISMVPSDANADWRYRRGPDGGAVAAGVIGGLALGAIAGGVLSGARPAYGYAPPPPPPRYYAPAPVYYARPPVVYDDGPQYCEIRRKKVWLDSWTYEIRRVRVCN